MNLPEGGREILNARIAGMTPANDVLVSYIRKNYSYSPVVFAKSGKMYDWRFLKDLKVIVIWDSRLPDYEKQLLAIASYAKAHVDVWFADKEDGETVIHLPTEASVLRYLDGLCGYSGLRWYLDRDPMLKFMRPDWSRWFKEVTGGTDSRFY